MAVPVDWLFLKSHIFLAKRVLKTSPVECLQMIMLFLVQKFYLVI